MKGSDIMATASKFVIPLTPPSGTSVKRFKPHKYQERAIRFLLDHPHAALFLDPGLGKTGITLGAMKVLQRQGLFQGALVVAPLRVAHSVWPQEVAGWEEFRHFSVAVLHGKDKDKLVEARHDIYVINYEGLAWLIENGHLDRLLKKRWVDVLVFDELSKMKNHATKRFKLMKPHLHKFRRRIGLTGSPAPNGLLDLFGQVYCLDQGKRLGRFVTHFRHKFFLPKGPYDWVPRPGADAEIQEALSDLAMSMRAEDYLELPPLVENQIMVELPPKARKAYVEVENLLFTQLETGSKVTALGAGSALGKCKQIANGAVYLGDVDPITGVSLRPSTYETLHDAKVEALLDLVDELQGKPLLVAYEFKHDLERLLKVLPKGTPYIGGGTKADEANLLVAKWNAGMLPILLGHPASIGHGLNLQKGAASDVAWFSPTWNYELYDQFNRRLWRQGSKADRVRIHLILAKDTVDIDVVRALRHKGKTQDALIEALKERKRGKR